MKRIGIIARIFTAGVYSIYTLKADDHFIHCPQYTGYPPKLPTRTLPTH